MQVYYCFYFLRLDIKLSRGEGWDIVTCLTPPHSYTCTKPATGFPMPYVVVFLCSLVLYESWLFVMLVLVELLTIAV